MEVEKILDAGSGILNDVMAAVETNQYQDLGRKISDRVQDVTGSITGNAGNVSGGKVSRDDTVYSGTVERTNKRDGVYRTNYNSGAYSSDAYRHYSSERRNGPVTPNSSSRARAGSGGYSSNTNRAGYDHVYGQGAGSSAAASSTGKGAYGKYDYRNPQRQSNLNHPGNGYQQGAGQRGQAYQGGAYANASNPAGSKGAYGRYDPHNPAYRQNMSAAGPQGQDTFFAPTPFVSKNVSKNTGIGSMVTGSLGMAAGGIYTLLTGIGALSQMAAGVTIGLAGGVVLLSGALFTGAFGLLFSHGKKKKDIVSDYYSYGRYVGNAEFFNIKDLAGRLGLTEGKLKKRLGKMMNQGLLPHARLDDEGQMLLLTDKAYDQYRQAADSYKKRQEEDQKRENYFNLPDADSTVKELLSEGNEYLKRVRYYNDLIPDTLEMSNKLYRLENIMYRIFEQVKKKPEMAPNLRKFMEYYLPTTQKLLGAYIEVDKQPQVGDNITNTKKEIETALDTINDAFEKLLDSLFEDMAWDISSDISVMKTMLEQDGLT